MPASHKPFQGGLREWVKLSQKLLCADGHLFVLPLITCVERKSTNDKFESEGEGLEAAWYLFSSLENFVNLCFEKRGTILA